MSMLDSLRSYPPPRLSAVASNSSSATPSGSSSIAQTSANAAKRIISSREEALAHYNRLNNAVSNELDTLNTINDTLATQLDVASTTLLEEQVLQLFEEEAEAQKAKLVEKLYKDLEEIAGSERAMSFRASRSARPQPRRRRRANEQPRASSRPVNKNLPREGHYEDDGDPDRELEAMGMHSFAIPFIL
ncbi:hypothetical protein C8R43DRAFT_1027897 [Mycena crocata]|nr:hypothetical protein C8R43DRAFT_1027897 [Mycena crocata]